MNLPSGFMMARWLARVAGWHAFAIMKAAMPF
jgi:hypothetical protein